MRTFTCTCGNTLYFDNTQCVQCGATLGFDPTSLQLISLANNSDDSWHSLAQPEQHFHLCHNYQAEHVCNWLVPQAEADTFCLACRLNSVIPDLSVNGNRERWFKLEKAKRRLIYTLLSLQLPINSFKMDKDHGLAFRFMGNVEELDPFSDEVIRYDQIMTGHEAGTITINIIEADDSAREKIREIMNESYRTILGHFRHEIGHYYWDQLIGNTARLQEFREVFGDERSDYKNALTNYYQNGPDQDWYTNYITAYASTHPWEDWAESWAHYLHCVDILETASHHEVAFNGGDSQLDIRSWLANVEFKKIISQLDRLMRTLNELNRSLGLPDPYPFEHSPKTVQKLEFIHNIIMNE